MEGAAPVTVRRARAADAPHVLRLWEALHREHEAMDPRYRLADDAVGRWATDLRDWTRSDGDRVLVAEAADGTLVGLAVAHLAWPPPVYAPLLMVWVDDLYVVPALRGRGVARQILDALKAWGRAAGATELRAGVLATNPAGRPFWQRAGAADYSVNVTLSLEDRSET